MNKFIEKSVCMQSKLLVLMNIIIKTTRRKYGFTKWLVKTLLMCQIDRFKIITQKLFCFNFLTASFFLIINQTVSMHVNYWFCLNHKMMMSRVNNIHQEIIEYHFHAIICHINERHNNTICKFFNFMC